MTDSLLTRALTPRPINVAEAIVAPLFDPSIFDAADFHVADDTGDRLLPQGWDGCGYVTRSPVSRIVWNGDLLLGNGYDSLVFFITLPPGANLSGHAIIYGARVSLFGDIGGQNVPLEAVSAPLVAAGAVVHVSRIELTVANGLGDEIEILLRWVGVRDSARVPLIEQTLPVYSAEWPGLLDPNGTAALDRPIYFSPVECDRIKRRINDPAFYAVKASLEEMATEWEAFEPEAEIREYVPCVEHLYRYVRVRDRGRTPIEEPMMVLAIAGYLLDRPDWSRLAARMVLSVAHTPRWFEGPQSATPGSSWRHVCFMEDHYSSAVATALQFVGSYLTDAGRKAAIDAVERAWPVIDEKCAEPGYRWHMNQGLVGNRGRILGALCLYYHGRGERYREAAVQAYRDHCTIMNGYLAEDGHAFEGPAYFGHYSLPASIQLWTAYATLSQRPIAEIVPGRVHASTGFFEAMMSTVDPLGRTCPINASGPGERSLMPSLSLAFLASVCGWQQAYGYLARRFDDTVSTPPPAGTHGSGIDVLFLLSCLPDTLDHAPVAVRSLQGCRKSGLMAYEFPAPSDGKLWFLCERNAAAGHHHYDRGSIVLEANGEIVLLDPGITNYSNPQTAFMKLPSWHNMAYVDGMIMHLHAPDAPPASLSVVEATSTGVRFAGDAAPVIDPPVQMARREGELSLDGALGTLHLTDTWHLVNVAALHVAYQSYTPWIIDGQSAVTRAERTGLTVAFTSPNGALTLTTHSRHIDGNGRPVYTLVATSELSVNHEVHSQIEFSRH
ncbi:MAG TPA: hypothetical protein VGK19_02475 [Capsulimonadaceae bacterium]|jgi:hypothetical protein